jgi:Fe-S cluster assembly ATP-binding protein
MLFELEDLVANVEGTPILRGVNLKVKEGEIHAIMGPNGAGKSTLARVISGHPDYEVEKGSIKLLGANLLALDPAERSHAGLFMSFQYPLEIPGVSNITFLKASLNAHLKARGEDPISDTAFYTLLEEKMELLEVKREFKERNLNEGFSGGEKKRNEILQMALLTPKVAILDETDSGLDIDALRVVSKGVNQLMHAGMGLILITHYQRLLDYIRPDVVHVMIDGKIVQSGDASLALELEEKGYDWLTPEGTDDA